MTYVKLGSHDAARLDEFRRDFVANSGTHELRQFQAFTAMELLTVTVVVEGAYEAAIITKSGCDGNNDPAWRGWKHYPASDKSFDSLNSAVAYVFGQQDIPTRGPDYFNSVRDAYYAEAKRRENVASEGATEN